MNCRNDYILRLADQRDAAGLRALFESIHFSGNLSVQFLRGDDPLQSFCLDGKSAVVAVLEHRASRQIVAAGACILRDVYINGKRTTAGYLTGLKLLSGHPRAAVLIPQGFQLLMSQTNERVEVYYSTILSGNAAAEKLLGKARRNMPFFCRRGQYTVYCLATGGRSPLSVERGYSADLNTFYERCLPQLDYSSAVVELPGLSDEDFFCLRQDGRIQAACAVWNQQAYKQYRMGEYGGAYRILSKLPTNLLGYPQLPKPGTCLNYATVALLCSGENAPQRLLKSFLQSVKASADQYDLLLCGLHDSDARSRAIASLRHIAYTSELYEVFSSEEVAVNCERKIYMDVGSL